MSWNKRNNCSARYLQYSYVRISIDGNGQFIATEIYIC
jgi:hypothetical protein